GAAEQQHAFGGQSVATGAPRLLLVVLDALGRAGVHHVADVGAIDSHAEGDRGHHHFQPLGHEVRLHRSTLGAGQASVIGRAADAVTGGSFGQLLDVPASLTVDDAAFAGVAADDLQDLGEHVVAWKR